MIIGRIDGSFAFYPSAAEIETILEIGGLVRTEAEVVIRHKLPDKSPFPVVMTPFQVGKVFDPVDIIEIIPIRLRGKAVSV